MKLAAAFALALFLHAGLASAQILPPPPPINHDFDFWIGDWNVTTSDGKPAGTNRIEAGAGSTRVGKARRNPTASRAVTGKI